jgi:hypothetical protein
MANGSDQTRTTTVGEVLGRSGGKSRSSRSGLTGLAGAVGNDELLGRLEQGNGTRDELLELLGARLESMRDAQQAEIELTKRMDNTFRTELGDSDRKGDGPEPKRWSEAAALYEDAARALCAGQLHRGNQLMERAVKADKQAFQAVQPLVEYDKRLADSGASTEQLPEIAAGVSSSVACTDCPLPDSLAIAHAIQSVVNEGHDQIKGQRRELDPWWTLEEEEEEEEGEGA